WAITGDRHDRALAMLPPLRQALLCSQASDTILVHSRKSSDRSAVRLCPHDFRRRWRLHIVGRPFASSLATLQCHIATRRQYPLRQSSAPASICTISLVWSASLCFCSLT